eukprot:2367828-Pleurochrysis_carterae.AAC.3
MSGRVGRVLFYSAYQDLTAVHRQARPLGVSSIAGTRKYRVGREKQRKSVQEAVKPNFKDRVIAVMTEQWELDPQRSWGTNETPLPPTAHADTLTDRARRGQRATSHPTFTGPHTGWRAAEKVQKTSVNVRSRDGCRYAFAKTFAKLGGKDKTAETTGTESPRAHASVCVRARGVSGSRALASRARGRSRSCGRTEMCPQRSF